MSDPVPISFLSSSFMGFHSSSYILKVSTYKILIGSFIFRETVSYYLQPQFFPWALVQWCLSNTLDSDPSHHSPPFSTPSAYSISVLATSLLLDTQARTDIFPPPKYFVSPNKNKSSVQFLLCCVPQSVRPAPDICEGMKWGREKRLLPCPVLTSICRAPIPFQLWH